MLLLGFHKDLLNDLGFIIQHSVLSNYADDNNLFVIGKNKEDIKSLLLLDFEIVVL